MPPCYPDLQRHSFLRPPDWRWRRAGWLVAHGRNATRRRDDDATRRAASYLRALSRVSGDQPAVTERQYPDVAAAHRLYDAGGTARLLVQARLLARQCPDDVARLTGVAASVVDAYEALFFHCRDRLDARDCVDAMFIGRAGRSAAPDPAAVLMSFAYHGGPWVLDAVLPYLVGGRALFDPPPDLATPEGRFDASVRLAVAAELLPDDAATDRMLLRIGAMLFEYDRQRPKGATAPTQLANNLVARLEELPAGARPGRVNEPESSSVASAAATIGEAA